MYPLATCGAEVTHLIRPDLGHNLLKYNDE